INDHAYHLIATIPGAIAGIAAALGLLGLIYRRVRNRTVYLSTTKSDKAMYILITLSNFCLDSSQLFLRRYSVALTATIIVKRSLHGYRQLFIFNPLPDLMVINDHAYHLIATIPGAIAGIAAALGLLGLIYRRV
ncbi:hypothetical protein BUE64_14170, partial [Corynebacterium diphtheriae subsp. lausannense]